MLSRAWIALKDNFHLLKAIITKFSRTAFVHNAITDGADLTEFKQRPTPRTIIGIGLIALSYLIGWPVVAVLGALSIYLGQALIVVVGGPVVYLLSHLVFLLGMYLAGIHYSWIFLRWLTRITMVKLMKWSGVPIPPYGQDC